MKMSGQDRRDFLKAAGAAAGSMFLPRVVFGGRKAASLSCRTSTMQA
jgi:hypothetical protein